MVKLIVVTIFTGLLGVEKWRRRRGIKEEMLLWFGEVGRAIGARQRFPCIICVMAPSAKSERGGTRGEAEGQLKMIFQATFMHREVSSCHHSDTLTSIDLATT